MSFQNVLDNWGGKSLEYKVEDAYRRIREDLNPYIGVSKAVFIVHELINQKKFDAADLIIAELAYFPDRWIRTRYFLKLPIDNYINNEKARWPATWKKLEDYDSEELEKFRGKEVDPSNGSSDLKLAAMLAEAFRTITNSGRQEAMPSRSMAELVEQFVDLSWTTWEDYYKSVGLVSKAELTFSPATEDEIERVERKTGISLPADYKELLRVTNGYVHRYLNKSR
jgi:hypothetical protein